jgi:FKBP-type peptidyl-prolyl cis-trans isomerase 2
MQCVTQGDEVRIHYTTRSMHGNVIETSEHREPFEFRVGGSDVIQGLSLALLGMQVGDKKHVTVSHDQAFGPRDPKLQQHAPRAGLPEQVEEGDQLTAHIEDSNVDIWIRSVLDDELVLDANHPLAGESLILDVELIGIGPVLNKKELDNQLS